MARRHGPFFEMNEALIVYETPELLARRARLRRVVLGTLSASVALLMVGLLLRHGANKAESALLASSRPPTATRSALLSREAPAPAVSTSPPVPSSSPAHNDDPRELTRAARALLAAGQTREGVAAARVAVDANPSDAEPYILLATGLQDLGNWPEAHTVFMACEQKTERGPNASCRYFAGR